MNSTRNAVFFCVMALAALGLNLKFGHIQLSEPHPMPISDFPLQTAGWQENSTMPVDPAVQKALPSATIIERTYKKNGQEMDLELVTASNWDDLHDPTVCFPAQGWLLADHKVLKVDGQPMNFFTATKDNQVINFLWYIAGGFDPSIHLGGETPAKLYTFRRLFTGHEGGSLVVRMSNNAEPAGSVNSLENFASDIQPAIKQLLAEGNKKR